MARRTSGNGRRIRRSDLPGAARNPRPKLTEAQGTLIIIGGHEEREGDAIILRAVAERTKGGKLVVATLATSEPEETYQEYRRAFTALGVKQIEHLDVPDREDLLRNPRPEIMKGASVVFFTGGGQLRITTQFGGTQLCEQIQEFYRRGGTIAGTSAGASVMSDTMLVSGDADSSHRVGANLLMAPGLGYIKDVIIDQHFAERGRIGRLLGAVAQNPRLLGIGIDENTAIVVEKENRVRVLGEGAVYIVDGRQVTSTNMDDDNENETLSIFNVRLHVLSQGDEFDLWTREPIGGKSEKVKREFAKAPSR
jgi:cyanophycinase